MHSTFFVELIKIRYHLHSVWLVWCWFTWSICIHTHVLMIWWFQTISLMNNSKGNVWQLSINIIQTHFEFFNYYIIIFWQSGFFFNCVHCWSYYVVHGIIFVSFATSYKYSTNILNFTSLYFITYPFDYYSWGSFKSALTVLFFACYLLYRVVCISPGNKALLGCVSHWDGVICPNVIGLHHCI